MSVAEKFLSMEYGPAPEDPREALVWLDQHGRKLGHFIGGSFRPPAEGVYFDTLDPSTGERLAAVAQGSAADIDAAVKAARGALAEWQSLKRHAGLGNLTLWLGKCKNIRGGWRSWKQWTTANRFARAATWIFRLLRATFITMRDGRSFCRRNFLATSLAAWWGKSFRGLFRC